MKWDYVSKELCTVPAIQKGPNVVQLVLSTSWLRTPPGPKPSLEPTPRQLSVLTTCPNPAESFLLSFSPSGWGFKQVSCLPSTHQLHPWMAMPNSGRLESALVPLTLGDLDQWFSVLPGTTQDLNCSVCTACTLKSPPSLTAMTSSPVFIHSYFHAEVPSMLCHQAQSIYFTVSGCLINGYCANEGFLLGGYICLFVFLTKLFSHGI